MSNMCLVPTPAIRELADKIKQTYPEACIRNNFNDYMCAEWIGLYNADHPKVGNLNHIPSMHSLVSYIEKLRNAEGKSFKRNIDEEFIQMSVDPVERAYVKYGHKGQDKQVYTVSGSHIYNKKGEEVYKENDPTSVTHRNRIFGNLAYQQKKAVIVEYRNSRYLVNDEDVILSLTGETPGHIMKWRDNDGNRREILRLAKEAFSKIKKSPTLTAAESKDVVNQLMDYFKSMGITIHNREELIKYLEKYNKNYNNYKESTSFRNVKALVKQGRNNLLDWESIFDELKRRDPQQKDFSKLLLKSGIFRFLQYNINEYILKDKLPDSASQKLKEQYAEIQAHNEEAYHANLNLVGYKEFGLSQEQIDDAAKKLHDQVERIHKFFHDVVQEYYGIDAPYKKGHFFSNEEVDLSPDSHFPGTQFSQEELDEMQSIKEQAVKDGTFMKAPNSKKSNLNERQWLQVRTKAFKRWFGDWENDPANASKVVDENGEPLVVYHYNNAGKSDIRVFNDKISPNGFWFTTNKSPENIYYPNTPSENTVPYPVFLNIKESELEDMTNESGEEFDLGGTFYDPEFGIEETYEPFIIPSTIYKIPLTPDEIKKAKDSGKSIMQKWSKNETFYAVFNPTQIKSAVANNGEFDGTNPDIQMMVVGEKGAQSLDAAEEATTRMDNRYVANKMKKAGKDALTIKIATGWERGADGKWRYEIPDVTLLDNKKEGVKEIYVGFERDGDKVIGNGNFAEGQKTVSLSSVADLSHLPKIYRDKLKKAHITLYYGWYSNNKGSYFKDNDGNPAFKINVARRADSTAITLVHEIQHFIQEEEGFSPGGNSDISLDAYLKQKGIYDLYYKLQKDSGVHLNLLQDILSADAKYNEYKDIIRKFDQALNMIPVEDMSDEEVMDVIKTMIPEYDDNIDYEDALDRREEELKKEHEEELDAAFDKANESIRKLEELKKELPSDYEAYRRIAGEAEARTAGARTRLSMEERRNSLFTEEMYKDVAKEDLIFLQKSVTDQSSLGEIYAPQGNPLHRDLFEAEEAYSETIRERNEIEKRLRTRTYEGSMKTNDGDIQISQSLPGKNKDTFHISSGDSVFNRVNMSIQANANKNLIGGSVIFPSHHILEKDKNYNRLDNPIKANHAAILKTVLKHFIDSGHNMPASEWVPYSSSEITTTVDGKEHKVVLDNYKTSINTLSKVLGIDVSPYFRFELSAPIDTTGPNGEPTKEHKERVIVDAEGLMAALPTLQDSEQFREINKAIEFNEQDKSDYTLQRNALTRQLKALEEKSNEQRRVIQDIEEKIRKEEKEFSDLPFYKNESGEVYGFVDPLGELYFDESVVKPEHLVHEYTHLWDRAVAKHNEKLWKKGVALMRNSRVRLKGHSKSLWEEYAEDENYGKKWKEEGKSAEEIEFLIASEVHARLVGNRGEILFTQLVQKDHESKGIIAKLKRWVLDNWRYIKETFGTWTDDDLRIFEGDVDKALDYFNNMTLRDMAVGLNPNVVTSKSPVKSQKREATVKKINDYFAWQKAHIYFDEETHIYYIDGKPADYSVSQYMEKIYGKPNIQGDYSHSREMGNSVDRLTRDFFDPDTNVNEKKYPNLNDERKSAIINDLIRLKEYFDKTFVNSEGKSSYNVITSEIRLAANIMDEGSEKTIAGTPDMIVVDDKGDIYVFDMKVKNHSIDKKYIDKKGEYKEVNDRRDYTFQQNGYKQILETILPEFQGRIKGLNLIWFDTEYPGLGKEVTYTTFPNKTVLVTDTKIKVKNLPLAQYNKWKTPNLKEDIEKSLIPLKVKDVLPISSAIESNWDAIPSSSNAQQSNLPGSETKMDIWWGRDESDPKRQNADLSNFAERPVYMYSPYNYGFVKFRTVEGAFQAAKLKYADIDGDTYMKYESILADADGATAKNTGRQIPNLDEKKWNENSSAIMKDIIKKSFQQNPTALQRLLATGNATLTHENESPNSKWRKEFPELLMQVRDELRGTQPSSKPSSAQSSTQPTSSAIPSYYEGKVTPDANTIFVFGSNPKGIHGAGAAAVAANQFGAQRGIGEGLTNNAYALPTKDLDKARGTRWYRPGTKENAEVKEWYKTHSYSEVQNHPLNAERSITPQQIIVSIKKLYEVARQNPNKQFKVSHYPLGEVSLNGYLGEEMREMFIQAGVIPSNVIFNKEWVDSWPQSNTSAISFTSTSSNPVIEPTVFEESKVYGYKARTIANASADATIALAVDFTSAGEKLTRDTVINQGKKYISVDTNDNNITDSLIERIVNDLNSVSAKTLNIAGNGIYTMTGKYTQEEVDEYVYELLKRVLNHPNLKTKIESIRSGGQTGYDEAGIKAAQRLGIKNKIFAPMGWTFRVEEKTYKEKYAGKVKKVKQTGKAYDISDEAAFKARFGVNNSQKVPESAETPKVFDNNNSGARNSDVAKVLSDRASSNGPKPLRPQSEAFESALQLREDRITEFYRHFSAQQIKDRGSMIADMFSKAIDTFIKSEVDRIDAEIKKCDEIIKDASADSKTKEEAQDNKAEHMRLKNLYLDPVNGRQFAANKKGIGTIISEIKTQLEKNRDLPYNSKEKRTLWQNTIDYFDELFNAQASLEIDEQEGIRIVNLKSSIDSGGIQTAMESADDADNNDDSDGNDETGHEVSGNDGWIFKVRYQDPSKTLSKKVKRLLYNIERSSDDVDDLGYTRKYPMGQIYATLLSYMAKHVESPDDFMILKIPDADGKYGENDKDSYGNLLNDPEFEGMFPKGYPTFPVLEKMKNQYPWVEQLIQRLTDDWLGDEWNNDLRYPSTFGAVASQMYTNFRTAFIPYGKIIIGEENYGVTPLNYDMEERCQFEKLDANFKNGLALTNTSIYNQDTTINRKHAKILEQKIMNLLADDNVSSMFNVYVTLSDGTVELEKSVIDEYNRFIADVCDILNSFGIETRQEHAVAYLAMGENGSEMNNMLEELQGVASRIANLSDKAAAEYNYMLDTKNSMGDAEWAGFFSGRGLITDSSYMQSFYDSASKKTKYSYSADNYMQKIFRQLNNPNKAERQKFMDEHFKKYEWFYNHETNTWRNKWLEHFYNADNVRRELPYRNIDNITVKGKNKSVKVRQYIRWEPDDIWYVQDRNYNTGSNEFGYYLAPIFSDSPMSMTIRGPKMGLENMEELEDAFISLIDQEMWRISYVQERAQLIKKGEVRPIANFDDKRGRKFCFLPELNKYMVEGKPFLQYMIDNKKSDKKSKKKVEDIQRKAIHDILRKKALEYMIENSTHYAKNNEITEDDLNAFLPQYYNMAYADAAIIQITTVDLAFYKNAADFQKRFKEVYAGGIQINTNSRFGKKTENVLLLADDMITSPSYDKIYKNIQRSTTLSQEEKDAICKTFKKINVADAQAIRSMHSYRAIMDMMGKWDDRMEKALERFRNKEWNKADYDIVYQTIKPFVYAVIEKRDGKGGFIPVPVQHKNSEICALMMYDLIVNDLKNSPVYEALSDFMENTKDKNKNPIIDMIQFESAGKVGNQGVINISFNRRKLMNLISKNFDDFDDSSEENKKLKALLNKYVFYTAEDEEWKKEHPESKEKRYLPNDEDHAVTNYKAIKQRLDKSLENYLLPESQKANIPASLQISQEDYNSIIAYLRPTKEEIMDILSKEALKKEGNDTVINPEVVQTVPFEFYYQAQPTPVHHVDAEATFGSQARNISVADLPENFTLVLEGRKRKGKKVQEKTFVSRDAVIDFFYELLNENLLEDFYGSRYKKGLQEIFSSKKALKEAIEEIVRGNPKYGKDFVDALNIVELADGSEKFTLSPNSPTMFTLMQELITSLFKNHITKQKINGAALIQAAGIGLDKDLRVRYDENDKIVGAECYMPVTAKAYFEPLLVDREITDENGNKTIVKVLDPQVLSDAELEKAIGYRIPSENKSSMMPLIIKGFTPLQNGSVIVLPAEITNIAGSDFDVDKMFIMLLSYRIETHDMKRALKDYAAEEHRAAQEMINSLGKANIADLETDELPDNFREWFEKRKDKYKHDKPIIRKVEYDFDKSPKENGRKARNNMIIQMMFKILTSQEGSESLLNPQGFPDAERAAKITKILTTPSLRNALLNNFGAKPKDAILPPVEQMKAILLERKKEKNPEEAKKAEEAIAQMTDAQVEQVYMYALSNNRKAITEVLLKTPVDSDDGISLNAFIEQFEEEESPIYPQAFAHSHARNMAGTNQIGIYAIQSSMAAKYQRADIQLKDHHKFKIDNTDCENVDKSDNGKRVKNVGQMVGGSADNGKNPILSDMGSTSDTAPIIGYLLRMGLSHIEAALIVNQPILKMCDYNLAKLEETKAQNDDLDVVTKDMLVMGILLPDSLSNKEQRAVNAMCWRVLKQAKAMEYLTQISRADSPNGSMQNTFAKARIQQYNVDLFNAKMGQEDFPFKKIKEALSNSAIDVNEGEEAVRQKLKSMPMSFLHAMYALGINSLEALASPYFYMLKKEFDDKIVKPILYNLSDSISKEAKEEVVNKIYTSYITYMLSSSSLFGDETKADGTKVTMREKRDYYLESFPDDFAETLQNNEDIRILLGNILVRENGRVVLKNVGTLGKSQKDEISRRLDKLVTLGEEGRKLATDLLMYAYYDNGLNFTHDSYSTRLSTYFLTQFPVYTETLNKLDQPLSDDKNENFIEQFLLTYRNATVSVESVIDRETNVFDNDNTIVIEMYDPQSPQVKAIMNTILSPNPRIKRHPHSYITYNDGIYILEEDKYLADNSKAVYRLLPEYDTDASHPFFNINRDVNQLSDDLLKDAEARKKWEKKESAAPESAPEGMIRGGNSDPDVDIDDLMLSNTSGDNPDIDNSLFIGSVGESNVTLDDYDEYLLSAGVPIQPDVYESEGRDELLDDFC